MCVYKAVRRLARFCVLSFEARGRGVHHCGGRPVGMGSRWLGGGPHQAQEGASRSGKRPFHFRGGVPCGPLRRSPENRACLSPGEAGLLSTVPEAHPKRWGQRSRDRARRDADLFSCPKAAGRRRHWALGKSQLRSASSPAFRPGHSASSPHTGLPKPLGWPQPCGHPSLASPHPWLCPSSVQSRRVGRTVGRPCLGEGIGVFVRERMLHVGG